MNEQLLFTYCYYCSRKTATRDGDCVECGYSKTGLNDPGLGSTVIKCNECGFIHELMDGCVEVESE